MSADRDQFHKVEAVFHQILALPHAQRAEALESACMGRPDMRREVESLLAHAGSGPADLEWTQALRTCPPGELSDVNLGRQIGSYEIQRKLGTGGMGNVYLAVQTEPVKRTVALKLIKRGLDTDETIRRFENERQVLATLSHANISQLLDGGATPQGLPYFVMEYVVGEPITSYCDRHRLTIRQRLEVFRQVCTGVHFAHQNTVIHRDLKPANILVTADGAVKLLDFGLAKLTSQTPDAHARDHTLAEYRLLTPEYASPEQILGRKITTASDIYSLGMILYELLAGRRPYELSGRCGSEIERIVSSDRELPRPSVMAGCPAANLGDEADTNAEAIARLRDTQPAQLCRHLKGDLDNIVLMALRKEPQMRYGSVEQFLADIDRHLTYQPVLAAPPSSLYRLHKFARRNRVACVLIAAMVFGLIGSVAGFVTAMQSRNAARAAAEAARNQAERSRRESCAKQLTLAVFNLRDNDVSSVKQRLHEVTPDLRGWEWHFLLALTDESHLTLQGHQGPVPTICYSPDGRAIISGGHDATVRVWDAQTGERMQLLRVSGGRVNSVACSPGGGQIVAATSAGVLDAWQAAGWIQAPPLNTGGGSIQSVRFSPDGRWLATGTQDEKVRLWDTGTGALLWTMEGYDGRSDSLAFSTDGSLIAAGGNSRAVRLWQTATGAEGPVVREFVGPITSITFSPNGKTMAVAARNQPIRLVDTKTWSRYRSTLRDQLSECLLVFSPDSRRLVSATASGYRVRLVDTESRRPVGTYRGHDDKVLAVAFSPNGGSVASAGSDGIIKTWDSDPVSGNPHVLPQEHPVTHVAFCPDGRFFVSGDEKGTLRIWDAVRRAGIRRMAAHSGQISVIRFSSDARTFAVGSMDGDITVWDAVSGSRRQQSHAHAGGVFSLAFAPGDQKLISGGADAQVKVWDVASGVQIGAMMGHQGSVRSIVAAAGGCWVMSAGEDGVLRLWDVATGVCVRELKGHVGPVFCLAASPTDDRIVSAGADKTLRWWDCTTGSQLRLVTIDKMIHSLAFNASGTRLVSTGDGMAVRIWDAEFGLETLALSEHSLPPTCAVFSPDGNLLASGGKEARIILRDAKPYSAVVSERARRDQLSVEAGSAMVDLRNRLGDWQEIAAAVRSDQSMTEPLRCEILNSILKREAGPGSPVGDWEVAFFSWPATEDFQEVDRRWQAARAGPNVARVRRKVIDFNWDKHPPLKGMASSHFGFVATASLPLQAGRYLVDTTSDDGLRVYLDGHKVIDDWSPHMPTRRSAEINLADGSHTVRIEYFQMGGAARARFGLQPLGASPASPASRAAP